MQRSLTWYFKLDRPAKVASVELARTVLKGYAFTRNILGGSSLGRKLLRGEDTFTTESLLAGGTGYG